MWNLYGEGNAFRKIGQGKNTSVNFNKCFKVHEKTLILVKSQ